MEYKAVLFDLDGVIVNSEILSQSLTERFIEEYHYEIPKENFYSLIGAHKSQNPWVKVLAGIDLKGNTIDEFVRELHTYKNKLLKDINYNDWLFNDIKDSLKMLKDQGFKIACASSSNIIYIKHILEYCGIDHYFDLVVTGDDFKESKPNPEIYLYCANKFNLAPSECLVIEDSPYGIQAGKNATMLVLARKDYTFNLDQSLADYHFDDLKLILNQIIGKI